MYAALVAALVLVPAIRTQGPFGIESGPDRLYILDFASHFNFVKEAWTGELPEGMSAYSVENHLRVTSRWHGQDTQVALPFGYSPTMLWVLAPLVPFSHSVAFVLFNVVGLGAVWWQTRPRRYRAGWGLVTFFSPLGFACFLLGQTAVLTGAGLLLLFERSREAFRKVASSRTFTAAVLLWALSAKPPLALTAGAVLVGLRAWRPVVVALALTAVTTAAAYPLMGPGWAADYVEMIRTYNLVDAAPAYAFSFAPHHMANLRGVLTMDFGVADDVATRVSSLLWLVGLAALAAVGPRLRLTSGGSWSAGVLLFLLFCPHVSSMEVLQVALLVPFCIPTGDARVSTACRVAFLAVPLLPFLSPAFLDQRIPLFVGLGACLVWVCLGCRVRTGPGTTGHAPGRALP